MKLIFKLIKADKINRNPFNLAGSLHPKFKLSIFDFESLNIIIIYVNSF